ncbi:MAG: hypothetical protein ACLP1X_33345 [Polyangiaceae bacterium]
MRRAERWRMPFVIVAGIAVLAVGGSALARDGGSAPPPPRSAPVGEQDETDETAGEPEALPPGHPSLDTSNPHAHAAATGAMPGVFQPPEDTETEDLSIPPGSIAVDLRDADDKPVPGEAITLGILINSIAKGDSRKHLQATTDDHGHAVFSALETASNIAYRVSSGYRGGSFAASPFQLHEAKAMRVVLHVYPVTRDIQNALIVCEATVAAEMRDDRIHVEQVLTIYNLGRTAWLPDDVRMPLPDGYTAFSATASMSDQGVDEAGSAAKLRGTFPPGRHGVDFRWQLPWSGDKDVDFDVGLPPHVAIARVMMPAMADLKLNAAGFPPAEVRHDAQGQTFLVTERRLKPDDARLDSLSIGIHDLPTPGTGRLFASLLAACGVCVGLVLATSKRLKAGDREAPAAARGALLEDLADLERAHAEGEVGPRTYERARRELIDALARTLAGSKPTSA